MVGSKLQIPPLVFGHLRSKIDLDLFQMQSTVNLITNWISEFDILDKSIPFQHRTSVFSEDGVRIISVASSPTVMRVVDVDYTIAIPLVGVLQTWVAKNKIQANTGAEAIFNPKGRRYTEAGIKSVLLISISEKRLQSVAETMLGDKAMSMLKLDLARALPLRYGSLNFIKVFSQTCSLIEQFDGNPQLLSNFSISETIVRAVVMMLAPQLFFHDWSEQRDRPAGGIQLLCEYLSENLDQPISMTTLETVTGMSGRAIQLQFKKQFACTPMQWIRQQRIARAFSLLRDPTPMMTVSQVGAYCGYSNFSDFARHYAKQCGELPSETLKKYL